MRSLGALLVPSLANPIRTSLGHPREVLWAPTSGAATDGAADAEVGSVVVVEVHTMVILEIFRQWHRPHLCYSATILVVAYHDLFRWPDRVAIFLRLRNRAPLLDPVRRDHVIIVPRTHFATDLLDRIAAILAAGF